MAVMRFPPESQLTGLDDNFTIRLGTIREGVLRVATHLANPQRPSV